MVGPWDAMTEIQKRTLSTQRTLTAGPQVPVGEGVRSPFRIQNVCCDLHRHDRQKVILLTGLILPAFSSIVPALSSVMANEP
jgi:hypothetical protein